FVNVSPAQYNAKETVNSLNFASRAKSVALGKATKNREAAQSAVNKVSTTLNALQEQANEADKKAATAKPVAAAAAKTPAGGAAAARKPAAAPGGRR
ncbi:hypothetical protein T492DRAFT_866058, partial [Pavlovales sp. CCMP2436]